MGIYFHLGVVFVPVPEYACASGLPLAGPQAIFDHPLWMGLESLESTPLDSDSQLLGPGTKGMIGPGYQLCTELCASDIDHRLSLCETDMVVTRH